jgi:predicted metalloendopeptidase
MSRKTRSITAIATPLLVLAPLCLAVLAGTAPEAGAEARESPTVVSGIDKSGFDESVRPQDDFHLHVNGGWLKRTEIPADKTSWGSFVMLREEADAHSRAIIEELANKQDLQPGSEPKKVGDLFASLMDSTRIEQRGLDAIRSHLSRIDAIASVDDLTRAFAEFSRSGVNGPFFALINVDSGNSAKYAVYLTQSGLGLPNRNYYSQTGAKFDEIRAKYPGYIAKLFQLAGLNDVDARAQTVYKLEQRIAEAHWTPEDNRDATKTNNRYAVADLASVSSRIQWKSYLDAAKLGRVQDIFVRQPSYMEKLGPIVEETALEDWKNYLRFHVINTAAPWMSQDFANAQFEFAGKLVSGQQQLEPRWQRAVQAVNGSMGEAVGKVYVERYFPPEAKKRMDALVANLLRAFETSIDDLEWMSKDTKARAQEKRRKFTTKIGYPTQWKDYTALQIARDDALGNLERAQQWEFDRRLARLDKPVERGEWNMNPQTVNAYHNSRLNEIVFPAGILQPPFFNLAADDAVNYGGIGAVIGHEIGHAFDDQGRKTDGNGNLKDWWTEADAKAFTSRAQALVEQYNGFEPLEDLFVNGQLTLGENIGDLTGVSIAYRAYQMSLGGKKAPVLDGLTGEERFFMGFAQVWRTKMRDESMRRQVLTNPHSPAHYRTIGPLRNSAAFYDVFKVREGDGMWLPPEKRVTIW